MKRINNVPKNALVYLVTGLILATLTPIIGRYITLPDALKGFMMGLGLAMEVIALSKIQKSEKSRLCVISKSEDQLV